MLPCEHSRINILQLILTKLGTSLILRRVWNPIDLQGHTKCRSKVKVRGSNVYPVNSRINILQWILTNLGTYLVHKRVWYPVDYQGHKSEVKVTGSNCLPRNILVTLENQHLSMDFDQTWYILSPLESETLLIFKVIGHRIKFSGEGIRHALRWLCFFYLELIGSSRYIKSTVCILILLHDYTISPRTHTER